MQSMKHSFIQMISITTLTNFFPCHYPATAATAAAAAAPPATPSPYTRLTRSCGASSGGTGFAFAVEFLFVFG